MEPWFESTLRLMTERVSPSTSEALARSWAAVKEKELSSSTEPRLTSPVTVGASLTGLTVRLAPAAVALMVPFQGSEEPCPSETSKEKRTSPLKSLVGLKVKEPSP